MIIYVQLIAGPGKLGISFVVGRLFSSIFCPGIIKKLKLKLVVTGEFFFLFPYDLKATSYSKCVCSLE